VIVVADASPLIALQRIGQLELLERLFGEVLVPPLVAEEFGPLPGWITRRTLGPAIPAELPRSLDPGEREAIALALELKAERVILDDLPARKAAGRLGLPVIGVLGILLACKLKGLISAVKPSLQALRNADFHFTPALGEWLLLEAGEAEPEEHEE
jgi:hypothetical protein